MQYADLTSFTIQSSDYTAYKENSISYITDINNDIVNLSTNISILNTDINYNYVNITTLSTLSTAIDDQYTSNTTYIDDKIIEQHDCTDQEIEALRVEGYIQDAFTHAAAWKTSDEGKRLRKKVWEKISSKWASFSGRHQYSWRHEPATRY